VSPFAGQTVSAVPGEVTNVFSSGFYMQDPHPVGGPFKQAIEVFSRRYCSRRSSRPS
jgi:hypothetical protein